MDFSWGGHRDPVSGGASLKGINMISQRVQQTEKKGHSKHFFSRLNRPKKKLRILREKKNLWGRKITLTMGIRGKEDLCERGGTN